MMRAAEPLLSLHDVSKSFALGGNTIQALKGLVLGVFSAQPGF
ncbi:hypothetical protein [Massilia sp. YIM B04103]|nr:hypothetical protein [Massilia sp. YIM B04103]